MPGAERRAAPSRPGVGRVGDRPPAGVGPDGERLDRVVGAGEAEVDVADRDLRPVVDHVRQAKVRLRGRPLTTLNRSAVSAVQYSGMRGIGRPIPYRRALTATGSSSQWSGWEWLTDDAVEVVEGDVALQVGQRPEPQSSQTGGRRCAAGSRCRRRRRGDTCPRQPRTVIDERHGSHRTARRHDPARARGGAGRASRNNATSPELHQRCAGAGPSDGPGQGRPVEQRSHLEGGLVGRRHQHDVAAHHVADRAGQERVVRAAEQQGVDLGVDDRGQQPLGQHVHLVAAGLAPLDELDEARAGGAGQLQLRSGARRPRAGRRRSRWCRRCRSRRPVPLRVASTRDRTPGSITPTTGTVSSACSSSSAAAAAVLQATITSFTSCSSTSHR